MADDLRHATFVFERRCAASPARVFAALSDPVERASWGTPSDTAVLAYDRAEFREGGQDVLRCGSKEAPQFSGVTTYLDNVTDQRIVTSEVVSSEGRQLLIGLTTTTLAADGNGATVSVTLHQTSLAGRQMIDGGKFGHDAALDHLVTAMA